MWHWWHWRQEEAADCMQCYKDIGAKKWKDRNQEIHHPRRRVSNCFETPCIRVEPTHKVIPAAGDPLSVSQLKLLPLWVKCLCDHSFKVWKNAAQWAIDRANDSLILLPLQLWHGTVCNDEWENVNHYSCRSLSYLSVHPLSLTLSPSIIVSVERHKDFFIDTFVCLRAARSISVTWWPWRPSNL